TVVALDGTPQYSTTPASNGVATISGLSTSNSGDLVVAACLAVDTGCSAGTGYTLRNDSNSLNAATGTFGNSFMGLTGQTIEDQAGVSAGGPNGTGRTRTPTQKDIICLV